MRVSALQRRRAPAILPGKCVWVTPAGGLAGPQQLADLVVAQQLIEDLRDERDRIAFEHSLLDAATPWVVDLLGIGTRADSVLALLDAIEGFMMTAAQLEREAAAGDVDAAMRLRRGAERVLAGLRGVQLTGDLAADTQEAVDGALQSTLGVLQELGKLTKTVDAIVKAAPWVIGGLVALQLLTFASSFRR